MKNSPYRPIISLAVVAFFAGLGYALVNVSALPVYIRDDLRAAKWLGVVMGAFFLTDTLFRPVLGALGDRYGRRWLFIAAPAISSMTAVGTVFIKHPVPLIGLRILDGAGAAGLWPTIFAATGEAVAPERRGTAMSITNVAYMSSLALGPLFGGLANEHARRFFRRPHEASFFVASLLFVVALAVAFQCTPCGNGKRQMPSARQSRTFRISDLSYTIKRFPEMLVIAIVTFLGMGMVAPVSKLYAMDRFGMSETGFGGMLAPIAIALGVLAVPLGRFADAWGVRRSVCWGVALTAISMWAVTYGSDLYFVVLGAALMGLGFVIAFPAWLALISHITPPDRRGEVLGAVGTGQGVGMLIGVSLGGYLYGSQDLRLPELYLESINLPFFGCAALLTASTIICFVKIYRIPGTGPGS